MKIRTRCTNRDILLEAIETCGLLNKYKENEINSFQKWKELGYKVKRGEKATLKVEMWYPSKYKNNDNEEENTRFYMKKTALFTIDQVEKIEE